MLQHNDKNRSFQSVHSPESERMLLLEGLILLCLGLNQPDYIMGQQIECCIINEEGK